MLYHPGETQTDHTLRQYFDWKGLCTTVHDVCKKCPTCQRAKKKQIRKVAVCHISDYLFLFFCMLGIYYTRCGLLCEGLSSQNVDGGYGLCKSLPDDRAYCGTNIQFCFVVTQVSMSCYFGILNDSFGRPHERCRGYSLFMRLVFAIV